MTEARRLAILLFASLVAGTARAASSCHDLSGFPAVAKLSVVDGRVRAYSLDARAGVATPESPVFEFAPPGGWKQVEAAPTPDLTFTGRCQEAIPPIQLTNEELRKLRPELQSEPHPFEVEQTPVACARHGRWIWFALGFYSGEGTIGAGGVGRLDPATGALEVRRPFMLREASATDLAVTDEYVWVSTAGSYECIGAPPEVGLVRYAWKKDRDAHFMAGHGICGFAVHDLALVDGALWVATDLGVSTTSDPDAATPTWRNFSRDESATGGMREGSCDALFERLLASLPAASQPDFWSPFHTFYAALLAHNPTFLERYVERTRRERRLQPNGPTK